jgi:Ser/Thr protein kinase RdoA (MazF antagonist)
MEGVTEQALRQLLETAWGLRRTRLEPLLAGHTNSTFLVHGDRPTSVARLSWPGKPAEQVTRECQAIELVRGKLGGVAVPTAVPTEGGHLHVATPDGRWLHLFERIPGTAGVPVSQRGLEHAMRTLAALHAGLSRASLDTGLRTAWLAQRHERVLGRAAPPLAALTRPDVPATLRRIGAQLAAAEAWLEGPVQWLHGDFHGGNLLLADDRVCGVVDFDEVGRGAAWLEAAFAAFAFCRHAEDERAFRFDEARWAQCVGAYAGASGVAGARWWLDRRDALMILFCTDQVLIHLEAAQRGLWTPGPGMGFLGCWETLQALPDAPA